MSGINKAIIVGNVGRDAETRFTTAGDPVTNFSIATSETWKDKEGEKQEKTEWHNVVCFGKTAEIAGQYVKKGSMVGVDGKIQTRKWTDKEGQDRYSTEIVCERLQLLGKPPGGDASERASKPAPAAKAAPKKGSDDLDDDIPF